MAKKVLLKDGNEIVLPITRGELIVDSSGNQAFHSNEFLATLSLPGLMSKEDKNKIDNLSGGVDFDNEFVTLATNQTITGIKTFTNLIKFSSEGYSHIAGNGSYLRFSYNDLTARSLLLGKTDFATRYDNVLSLGNTGSRWSNIYTYNINVANSVLVNGKSLGNLAFKDSLSFSEITSKPTTLGGYGITDGVLMPSKNLYYYDLNTLLTGDNPAAVVPYFQRVGVSENVNNVGSARKGVIRLYGGGSESQLVFDHYNGKIYYRHYGASIFSDWSTILNSSNFSSYALPLSGGTIDSPNSIPLVVNSTSSNSVEIKLQHNSGNKVAFLWDAINGSYLYSYVCDKFIGILDDGTPYYYKNGYNTLIHSGNIGSYALPLSGGTIDGNIEINGKEFNKIRTVYNNDSAITNIAVGQLYAIRHALSFRWYETDWQIGNIRYSNTDSLGFGITKNNSHCVFRVNENGAWVNEKAIIHSGNIGSQSVSYATSAGNATSAGYLKSLTSQDEINGISTMSSWYDWAKSSSDYFRYGLLLESPDNNYKMQLCHNIWNGFQIRGKESGTWSDWKTIAFTDSNVASADYATSAGNASTLGGYSLSSVTLGSLYRGYMTFSASVAADQYWYVKAVYVTAWRSEFNKFEVSADYGNNNGKLSIELGGYSQAAGSYIAKASLYNNNNVRGFKVVHEQVDGEWREVLYLKLVGGSGANVGIYSTMPTMSAKSGVVSEADVAHVSFTDVKYNNIYTNYKINGQITYADKLTTPRTIWGQSFDGSGDITGSIKTDPWGVNINDYGRLCIAGYQGDTSHNTDGVELVSTYGVVLSTGSTAKSLAINSSGNVLIGTNTDSGYKLYVNGNSYVNGTVTATGFKTPTGTNDYVLLAGGGTKALSSLALSSYLKINDIRSTNHLPNATVYPDYSLTAWFNNTGTPTNAWYSGITLKGWTSGHTAWQLAGYSDTGAHYNLYYRPLSTGSNNSWAEWEKLLTNKPTATVYSGTANLSSYWCKVASVTIPCSWADYNATIVATRTHESNDVAIIHWNCRTNGTATATPTGSLIYTGTCGIGGSFRSYNSGAGNTTTFELWADSGGQWCGWQFTVLSETNRGGSIYRAASWYSTDFSSVQTPTYSNYITASQKTPNPSDYYWANVKVSPSSNSATSPTFSHATFNRVSDHGINVGTIRGMQVGSCTGQFIHMYERVHIGSPNGWGSLDAPSYGLSTYGGAWLATNTGNVGIGTTNPTSKLHVSGNLTIDNGSIYYQGSHAIYPMIKFINNVSDGYGNGIAIGGGGLTIVGSGESSDLFYTAGSGGGETLILSSDEAIVLYSNCQEGTSKAKSITLDTNGYLNTSYIHYGGHEKNNSNPSYVAGFNASDGYIRSYATSSLSVNYANSSGYANSAGWANSSANADGVASTGYGNDNFTYYQTSNDFFGNSGWSHYLIANHGDGKTYYNFTIGLPFWGVPIYKRLEGGTEDGWHTFITSENISSQSVNYATSAGNADTVDGVHSSAFAHVGTYNNLTNAGNEFTFASSAFSGVMWINYRTASGNTDGDIIQYNFGNGKGGCLAHISNGYFSGTASYANSSGNADTVDGVHLEWAGSQAASDTTWLAGWTSDGTKLKAVSQSSLSVSYANSSGWASSAGNADTLDGVDSTGFLRYYNSNAAPTNVNIVNTPSYVWTVSTTGGSVTTATKPYGIDNAWGVIHLHTHTGNFATQLGFGGTTGRMYMRNAYNTGTFGNWESLAFTSDLSSYATSSALNNLGDALDIVKATYLPLSGGTMTGVITMNAGTGIQMKYTSGGNDLWMYANGAPEYGIRYFEGNPDKMTLSASGNNNNTSTADLCINGNGEGTVTIRGNTIIHAGNIGSQSVNYATSAGNASSASKLNTDNGTSVKPVYFSGGVPVTCSYEIGCVKATKIETTSTTPKYLLGVTNDGYLWTYYHTTAYVNSNGVFWSSDRRLKDNIKSPVKNGMLNDETGLIRKFTWKDSGNASYGFIAQELMLHIPEAVDYDETLNKYSVNYDVAHSALIAQLVIKVKELESEISKLKQLIN